MNVVTYLLNIFVAVKYSCLQDISERDRKKRKTERSLKTKKAVYILRQLPQGRTTYKAIGNKIGFVS